MELIDTADSAVGLLGTVGGRCCKLDCEDRLDVEGLRKGKGGVGREGSITELLILGVLDGMRGGDGRGLL